MHVGASHYHVGLLFEKPPVLDGERLLAALQARTPGMSRLGSHDEALQFALDPASPEWEGTELPCTWVIAPTEHPPDPQELVQRAGQTWDWPEAKKVLARCRYKLVAGDFMGTVVPPRVRLKLLHRFLRAVVEQAAPLALEWSPSERFVDPAAYLAYVEEGDDMAFAKAALNVRMFNVGDGGEDEAVMDTRGMAELGLPDVQCRFQKLPRKEMAVKLASVAHLIFQKGDIIKDGDTVDGLTVGSRWSCSHGESLVQPARTVIDVAPPLDEPGSSVAEAEAILDAMAEVTGPLSPELRARALDPRISDRERAKLVKQAFSLKFGAEIAEIANQEEDEDEDEDPFLDPMSRLPSGFDPVGELEAKRKQAREAALAKGFKLALAIGLALAIVLVVMKLLF